MTARGLKRTVDCILSMLGIVGLSPLVFIVAIVLWKVQGTPIFFAQNRAGYKGSVLKVIKFRTLPTTFEVPQFSFQDVPSSFKFPSPEIGQFSPFISFMRRTGLDELPQLLLVLKGEMSLVGPRPEMIELASCYSSIQKKRLEVRPGLTGLAQVRGRNDIKYRHKIKYDLFYIQHQSLLLDMWIMWETFKLVGKSIWRRDT